MIVNPLAKIKEKKIPLIKLGVSSRTFFHWKKENILFENTEPDDTKQKVFLYLMDATKEYTLFESIATCVFPFTPIESVKTPAT